MEEKVNLKNNESIFLFLHSLPMQTRIIDLQV